MTFLPNKLPQNPHLGFKINNPSTFLALCLHIACTFLSALFRDPFETPKHPPSILKRICNQTGRKPKKFCNLLLLEKKKRPFPTAFYSFLGKGRWIMVLCISKTKTLNRLLFCELQMYHQVDFFANASSGWIVIDVVIKSINTCRSLHS